MSKIITINAKPETEDTSVSFSLEDDPNDPEGPKIIICTVTVATDQPFPNSYETTRFLMSDVVSPLTSNQRKLFLKACRDHAITLIGL